MPCRLKPLGCPSAQRAFQQEKLSCAWIALKHSDLLVA